MSSRPTVTFYFDPVSPYVWLASKQLDLVAPHCHIEWQPVLFAAMLNENGQKGPAEIPSKKAYTFRDVMRLAAQQGLRFTGPPGHPFNPLHALRLCMALPAQADRHALAHALLAAAWEDGRDISRQEVLLDIAARCGHDAAQLWARSQEPANKQALADNTRAALDAGVFGVPTWRLDDELFWGADRLGSLAWRLAGHGIDEAALTRFLAQPPLAQRS
jgi:2-hydroxychromene-2-carboxylate isomerase